MSKPLLWTFSLKCKLHLTVSPDSCIHQNRHNNSFQNVGVKNHPKTVFNIRDGRDAKKGSIREFKTYKGISGPRVNQEVVLVRDLEENRKIPL